MIFYDFEVFRYDWLVVLIDLNARKETVIINDPDKLKRFYCVTNTPDFTRFQRAEMFSIQAFQSVAE